MPITVDNVEKRMASASYMKGYSFSPADTDAFKGLTAFPDASATPNAFRWAKHISALTGIMLGVSAAPANGAKKAAAEDEDFDMFGDDEDEEEEWDGTLNADGESAAEVKAAAARRARMDAALKLKEAADAKKEKAVKKEKPAEKSLIVLEVKPWEAETDLVMVWKEICKTEQEGLTWGANHKLEEMAFGVKKLIMTCSIEDAKVLMDDVTDKIEAFEDWVQSVQVASMNKI